MADINKLIKQAKDTIKSREYHKSEEFIFNEWWSGRSLWGNTWAKHFFLCGPRGVGKSYDVMKLMLRQWKDSNGVRVFYWVRLTDSEQEMLLKGHASKLIDPDLRREYLRGYEIETSGSDVFVFKRDSNGKMIKGSKKLLCHVLALSTAHKLKGVGYYDKDYIKQPKAWYNIVFDEINREPTAKRTFDIAEAVKNTLESIVRKERDKIRIIYIGNLTGTSDLLAKWNFIPPGPGVFKLRRKGVLVQNIEATENYKKFAKSGAVGMAYDIDEDSNYSNELIYDRSLIINKKRKLRKVSYIIKFTKKKDTWFTVWDGNIVKRYNNDNCKRIIPMRKYIDEIYNLDLVNQIYDQYNAKAFYYKDLTTQLLLTKYLELLKK